VTHVALNFVNNIALFCDLPQSEKTVVSGQSSVILQAHVLAAVSVKFLFSQNKILDFSLRISYLFNTL